MSWGTPDLDGHEAGSDTEEEEEEEIEEEEEEGYLLPPELWLEVFDFLDGKDLTACQLVCKVWYALASRDRRAEEYVAKWREEKAKKEALRERQRQRRRQERRHKARDCSRCCVMVSFGCVRCVVLSALCPLCCPCITLFSLRLCCRGFHRLNARPPLELRLADWEEEKEEGEEIF